VGGKSEGGGGEDDEGGEGEVDGKGSQTKKMINFSSTLK
jgi:hypothetical protein